MRSAPLTGNPPELLRHDVVTVRCKHWISDIRKTRRLCCLQKNGLWLCFEIPINYSVWTEKFTIYECSRGWIFESLRSESRSRMYVREKWGTWNKCSHKSSQREVLPLFLWELSWPHWHLKLLPQRGKNACVFWLTWGLLGKSIFKSFLPNRIGQVVFALLLFC